MLNHILCIINHCPNTLIIEKENLENLFREQIFSRYEQNMKITSFGTPMLFNANYVPVSKIAKVPLGLESGVIIFTLKQQKPF